MRKKSVHGKNLQKKKTPIIVIQPIHLQQVGTESKKRTKIRMFRTCPTKTTESENTEILEDVFVGET